jgi:hypothetical protein
MSNETKSVDDAEFSAMRIVFAAVEALDPPARERVFGYVAARLGLEGGSAKLAKLDRDRDDDAKESGEAPEHAVFETFAELNDAARPATQPDKALVAGYWLQVCQGADNFDGFSANKELKHLGEGVGNITTSITALKDQQPALVIQLKKSGTSKQARKTYKVTVAGIRRVESMIGQAAANG